MSRSAVLKASVAVGAAVAAALCLVVTDFVVSLFWRPALRGVTIQKPYVAKDGGWYELQPNFAGYDQFGPYIYPVETDAHGFRRKPGAASAPPYEVIFLGDSFTYGMNGPWEGTFVGMYADDNTSRPVLNAGVSSYSPTAYLHQYKKALAANLLSRGHMVVVAIDISDVQDEAGIWTDGEIHPEKVTPVVPATAPSPPSPALPAHAAPSTTVPPPRTFVDFRASAIDALPNTWAVYHFVRYGLLRWNRAELIEHPRSAFTYQDWADLDGRAALQQEGYAPLGVAGGLRRVEQKLTAIVQAARVLDAAVYFLIYPWPAQVAHPDRFSWSAFITDVCRRVRCAGVIDTIAVFRARGAQDPDWLTTYYLGGDTHFTTRGNRVVADAVLNTVPR
jgi:hypothetical protein